MSGTSINHGTGMPEEANFDKNNGSQARNLYLAHYYCILGYYLRMSWCCKVNFLLKLIENTNRSDVEDPLELFMSLWSLVFSKMIGYSKTLPQTSEITFDQIPQDHSRMLEAHVLDEVTQKDFTWFKNLHHGDQLSIMLGLLRHSGGAILLRIYRVVEGLIQKRLRQEQTAASPSATTTSFIDRDSRFNRLNEGQKPDPADANFIRLTKLVKEYNDFMLKYRTEIEKAEVKRGKKSRKAHSAKAKSGNKKERDTNGKSSDSKSKSTKKKNKKGRSTSSKGSTASKAKKPKKESGGATSKKDLDWVQLLPIWIVKRIMGFLEPETLNIAKKVNPYWAWVIKDVIQSNKVKQKLEESFKKNQTLLGLDNNEDNENNPQQQSIIHRKTNEMTFEASNTKTKSQLHSKTGRRVRRLMERGAILRKLRIADGTVPVDEYSLLVQTIKKDSKIYQSPPNFKPVASYFGSFPRAKQGTGAILHKKPICMFKDINLIKHTQEESDINEADNFMAAEEEGVDESLLSSLDNLESSNRRVKNPEKIMRTIYYTADSFR